MFLEQLQQVLSDLFILGLERVDAQVIYEWQRVYNFGQKVGFCSLLEPMSKFIKFFEQKLEEKNGAVISEAVTDFNFSVSQLVLDICVLIRLCQDI
ncbi:hypothetical protein NIES2101_10045 [Calothrix sp. HK-06]|nr:hypothetical protein NIES2101_10045 [Calothrix sp. HK-06]